MTDGKTVKVELNIPIKTYKAIEYICSLEPKKDIKEYIVWALYADAECMSEGDWPEHIKHINNKLGELLST